MVPSIVLDYGTDAADCGNPGFEICERGMCFLSQWQFAPGTQLDMAFAYRDRDGSMKKVHAMGVIACSESLGCKCYRSILLFLEVPEDLRAAICAIRHHVTQVDSTGLN